VKPQSRERVVRFGPRQSLAGILSTPRSPLADVPFVVIINAGIVHRVGPNRLYVDIARALSARGYSALRFDLLGLGDSDPLTRNVSLTGAAISDIKTALDFLEATYAAKAFVLCGLCAGADYGMLTTFDDARVVGSVLIDPSVRRTRRGKALHYGRRLLHPATWGAMLTLRHQLWRRALGWQRGAAVARVAQAQSEQQEAPQLTEAEVRASIERVIARGVELMLVFTGGVNQVYNYRTQLFDLLPGLDFRDQLRLEFMPRTDHTAGDAAGRARLLRSIGDWINQCFPGKPGKVQA
jgi:dienelactone hydrolase